jgi:hypothetical protein
MRGPPSLPPWAKSPRPGPVRVATGNIRSIAHAGDPAPSGGVYRQAGAPVINDQGDIVFLGDL